MVVRTRERVHARILRRWRATKAGAKRPTSSATTRRVPRTGQRRSATAEAWHENPSRDRRSPMRRPTFETAMDALDKTPMSGERETRSYRSRIEARMAFIGSARSPNGWTSARKPNGAPARSMNRSQGRRHVGQVGGAKLYGTPLEAIATGEEVVGLAEEWGNPGWLNLAEYGRPSLPHRRPLSRSGTDVGRACARLMGPEPSAPIGTTAQCSC